MFLNTHTYYSLRYGTIAPKRLLDLAKKLQIKALAITDINTTSACIDSIRLASAYDIKTVVGVDFRNGVQQEFVMLAKNNQGFQHINSYLSSFLEHPRFKI
ncbi:PHP domain-containing protein [Tenacibaculum sp. SG-28]|uniref:PHP domain-containing protein n=1 Tax=Tenacibaculum sp. SG-28 TaxID=754426 RepID=UPI00268E24CF